MNERKRYEAPSMRELQPNELRRLLALAVGTCALQREALIVAKRELWPGEGVPIVREGEARRLIEEALAQEPGKRLLERLTKAEGDLETLARKAAVLLAQSEQMADALWEVRESLKARVPPERRAIFENRSIGYVVDVELARAQTLEADSERLRRAELSIFGCSGCGGDHRGGVFRVALTPPKEINGHMYDHAFICPQAGVAVYDRPNPVGDEPLQETPAP